MDVPDLVRQAVGDEEIRAGVNLGDEDAAVFTPTRALVYRGEGLLSDEDLVAYEFDFERLALSEGRRKTKFTMTYVDGERSFTVPGKRTDDVLEHLVEGMLRVAGAIDATESVTGAFRFSEMTIVVTEARLLKHIGEYTWDADFESFPYDDLTQLAFEEGSVATQVVLGVGNRSERIKAPNAEAGLVRKTLQEAVFAHYGVGSLEELNREIAVEPEADAGRDDAHGGLGLDSGIDPLVSDDGGDDGPADGAGSAGAGSGSSEASESPGSPSASNASAAGQSSPTSGSNAQQSWSEGARSQQSQSDGSRSQQSRSAPSDSEASQSNTSQSGSSASAGGTGSSSRSQSSAGASGSANAADERDTVPSAEMDTDDVADQLSDLTQAVERQNELLHRQQQTIEKLIEELRKGR